MGSYLRIERRIDVAAAQADVGADRAEDAAERVGPLPGRGEGADGPAAGPGDAAVVAVVRQPDRPAVRGLLRLDLGQDLLEQEPDVVVAQAVVLVAAVEPVQRLGRRRLDPPGRDEHADDDGHLLLVDQLIEDLRRLVLDAVLVDVQAGRLLRVVLLGDVDPVVAHRAREDLALVERSTWSPRPWAAGRRGGRRRRGAGRRGGTRAVPGPR